MSQLTPEECVPEIQTLLLEIAQAAGHAARCARKIGQHLNRVKRQLPHGEFTAWLEANFQFRPETARGYMNIARHWNQITERCDPEKLSINTALKILARLRQPPPPAEPTKEGLHAEAVRRLVSEFRQTLTRWGDDPAIFLAYTSGQLHSYLGEVLESLYDRIKPLATPFVDALCNRADALAKLETRSGPWDEPTESESDIQHDFRLELRHSFYGKDVPGDLRPHIPIEFSERQSEQETTTGQARIALQMA